MSQVSSQPHPNGRVCGWLVLAIAAALGRQPPFQIGHSHRRNDKLHQCDYGRRDDMLHLKGKTKTASGEAVFCRK